VTARPIGLLEMLDDGKEDDKIIAVPVGEPAFDEIYNYLQIFPHTLRKISHFFETYKALEGKQTAVAGWHDGAYARRIVSESHQRFLEHEPQRT
jgi:inorganic pyrophosphatase